MTKPNLLLRMLFPVSHSTKTTQRRTQDPDSQLFRLTRLSRNYCQKHRTTRKSRTGDSGVIALWSRRAGSRQQGSTKQGPRRFANWIAIPIFVFEQVNKKEAASLGG